MFGDKHTDQQTSARRRLLKGAALATLGAALPAWSLRALAQSDNRVTELGAELFLLQGMSTNAVALRTAEGIVLVDSGAPGEGGQLRGMLEGLSERLVHTLINTHYHAQQTGANEIIGRSGARIIAHENTREWMSVPHWLPAADRYEAARPEAARPTESFYEDHSLETDAGRIDMGLLMAAHTNGDIYVHFPAQNVLVVGDVVSPQVDLSFDYFASGWIGGRRDALDLLLELSDDNTRIVPAVGPVIGRAELRAERELVGTLYERTVDMLRQGFGPQDMLDAGVMDNLSRRFDDPYTFLYDTCKGLWAHHNKLAPNIV